jgi:hypothetical protein
MFWAFLAHPQEILLYTAWSAVMVNESVLYGVRWFGVFGLSMALSERRDTLNIITTISDIKLDTYKSYIYIYIIL